MKKEVKCEKNFKNIWKNSPKNRVIFTTMRRGHQQILKYIINSMELPKGQNVRFASIFFGKSKLKLEKKLKKLKQNTVHNINNITHLPTCF